MNRDTGRAGTVISASAGPESEPDLSPDTPKEGKIGKVKRVRKHYSVEKRYRKALNSRFNELEARLLEKKKKRQPVDDNDDDNENEELGLDNATDAGEGSGATSRQSRSQVLTSAIDYIDELEGLLQQKDQKIERLRGFIFASKLALEDVLK